MLPIIRAELERFDRRHVGTGNLPGIPQTACGFSGCPEPYARTVRRWRLCELHADRVEAELTLDRVERMSRGWFG